MEAHQVFAQYFRLKALWIGYFKMYVKTKASYLIK